MGSKNKREIEVRDLAEQFFKEAVNLLDDQERKEEVELEKETYIGIWMRGYRAGEAQPHAVWVKCWEQKPDTHKVRFMDKHGNEFIGNYSKDTGQYWAYGLGQAINDVIYWRTQDESAAGISQDAHEKEVMMQAFDKVREIFEGRQWIMQGRGSYPYNDHRYKEEVRYMYDEFDRVFKDTWGNIKSKSSEYREWIIAEYLQKDHPAIHDIYETRLALRMVLKVFKNNQISKEQGKYYSQAEGILKKHGKITDVLRSGREEDVVEFAEWAGWDWRRVEGKSMWENQKTLETLSTSKLHEKYKKETGR